MEDAPQDELDRLAAGSPLNIIALLLWKNRHRNPEMTEQITAEDVKGFRDCAQYLKVTPAVRIERPQGRPAQEAIPAAGNRRAVPAREAEPPRPYVVVGIVVAGTEDAIKPVENNEADNERRIQTEQIRRARENAGSLANTLDNAAASGDFSASDLRDAANALRMLASAK